MIRSRLRKQGAASFVIEDHCGTPQGLRGLASEHDRPVRILALVTDGVERNPTRGSIPNDPRPVDFRAPRFDGYDIDQTDELVRISRTDLGPRQRLRYPSHELFRSIHSSIFLRGVAMSSFLTRAPGDRRRSPDASSVTIRRRSRR